MEDLYKVARILDNYHIVITAGEDEGIEVGDKFVVIGKTDDIIEDPTNHRTLGTLFETKATVKVVELYDSFSICENNDTEFSPIIENNHILKGKKPLNVNKSQIAPISSSNAPIEVGDSVKKDWHNYICILA